MSLTGAWRTAVDDLVALATPLAQKAGARGRIVAVAEGEALALYEAQGAGEPKRLPARTKKRAAAIVELRLPASVVLTRELVLPAAGREYLDPIVEHRAEKLVPWSLDRALYGYRVAGETEGGELRVPFAATSRDIADKWLAKARALGLEPTALGSAAEPLSEPLSIDLWRGSQDRLHAKALRLVKTAAAIAALVVLPLLALSIWTNYSANERLERIEARSTAARRALQAAVGAGAGSREAALIAAKRPDAAMVTLIDRLARTLPKDTALRDMEIDQSRVRLAGASSAAPGLIARLEASGLMRDTRFAAPVTRGADGKDLFEILGQRVRPEPPQANAPAAGAGL
ncbi:fimbrial assembly protein [Chelatococcus sambhunathii]|uniref:Fimbrial assembly protein n=1 Tax=Chelatococcus sambhunathii TaxID=363953 RepID=A0ABU1DFI6_9HYPH|nr:PilN domain-containing protein [Chelatococcus sambhunathii]MDR4306870.1 fimbrial assembly protein [Chelatococcus sambhunathii]